LEVGKVKEEPDSSLTQVASVAEIDSLPGPLWKLLPRFDFGRGGDFRSLPYPAAGIDLLLPVNHHVAVDVT
jgi:hypothetical protein